MCCIYYINFFYIFNHQVNSFSRYRHRLSKTDLIFVAVLVTLTSLLHTFTGTYYLGIGHGRHGILNPLWDCCNPAALYGLLPLSQSSRAGGAWTSLRGFPPPHTLPIYLSRVISGTSLCPRRVPWLGWFLQNFASIFSTLYWFFLALH